MRGCEVGAPSSTQTKQVHKSINDGSVGRRHRKRRVNGFDTSVGEVFLKLFRVAASTFSNLLSAPPPCPPDLVATNPVVGVAGKLPVPDGRSQGDRLTVVEKLPLSRTDRRNDLVGATASAQMDCCCIRNRDIEDA